MNFNIQSNNLLFENHNNRKKPNIDNIKPKRQIIHKKEKSKLGKNLIINEINTLNQKSCCYSKNGNMKSNAINMMISKNNHKIVSNIDFSNEPIRKNIQSKKLTWMNIGNKKLIICKTDDEYIKYLNIYENNQEIILNFIKSNKYEIEKIKNITFNLENWFFTIFEPKNEKWNENLEKLINNGYTEYCDKNLISYIDTYQIIKLNKNKLIELMN